MFDQIVMLAAVVAGVAFFRSVRRREAGQRIYQLLLGAVTLTAVAGLGERERFTGIVAVSGAVLLVLVPGTLEWLARGAFGRGRLAWAVRLAGWRAMLMPGAGLSRQQEILRGLSLLEREGVDRALAHFRGLADETEDGGEIALIHEQIVSMLFYGQRWDEGIAHYEAKFHPRYAAMRPALALGLLRAYGESGRMETAAGLLRALEDGPIGSDPRARGLLSQARLTFLAYAGEAPVVALALSEDRRRALGLSAASAALLSGIALSRAGDAERAAARLREVERLAGASDDRVVDASRSVMERIDEGRIELTEELASYVAAVAKRLQRFLDVTPTDRTSGPLIATPVVICTMLLGYLAVLALGQGTTGVLRLGGLTPQLWHAGQWGRAILGMFVGSGPLTLLLAVYAIWMAGPLIERVHGRGRLVATMLLGGSIGLALAAATDTEAARVLAGAPLCAIAVTVGALWTLLPSRTPGLMPRARRSLMLPLSLVALALAVQAIPGVVRSSVPAIGLLWASVVGTVMVGAIPIRGIIARITGWLAVPLALLVPVAAWQVSAVDVEGFELARSRAVSLVGAAVDLPERFVLADPERYTPGLPVAHGFVDNLARDGGNLVAVLAGPRDPEAAGTVLVQLQPELDRELREVAGAELPPAFAAAWDDSATPATLRITSLRRNGADVGLVIERDLDDVTVALVAAPAQALDHAPGLYAAILAGARRGG